MSANFAGVVKDLWVAHLLCFFKEKNKAGVSKITESASILNELDCAAGL